MITQIFNKLFMLPILVTEHYFKAITIGTLAVAGNGHRQDLLHYLPGSQWNVLLRIALKTRGGVGSKLMFTASKTHVLILKVPQSTK